MMRVGPWKIPAELEALIASGFWPNYDNANQQNLKSLIDEDRVRAFAQEENGIWFDPPPFALVSDLIARGEGETFWCREEAHPNGISPEHAVVIGDFGLGSDAPIIMDYRSDHKQPKILRLRWGTKFSENRWIVAAKSFGDMCAILGIELPEHGTNAQQAAPSNR